MTVLHFGNLKENTLSSIFPQNDHGAHEEEVLIFAFVFHAKNTEPHPVYLLTTIYEAPTM